MMVIYVAGKRGKNHIETLDKIKNFQKNLDKSCYMIYTVFALNHMS